ncbi:polycystin-1-like [Branchiostoma floridae x Branchiostoma japonicum]
MVVSPDGKGVLMDRNGWTGVAITTTADEPPYIVVDFQAFYRITKIQIHMVHHWAEVVHVFTESTSLSCNWTEAGWFRPEVSNSKQTFDNFVGTGRFWKLVFTPINEHSVTVNEIQFFGQQVLDVVGCLQDIEIEDWESVVIDNATVDALSCRKECASHFFTYALLGDNATCLCRSTVDSFNATSQVPELTSCQQNPCYMLYRTSSLATIPVSGLDVLVSCGNSDILLANETIYISVVIEQGDKVQLYVEADGEAIQEIHGFTYSVVLPTVGIHTVNVIASNNVSRVEKTVLLKVIEGPGNFDGLEIDVSPGLTNDNITVYAFMDDPFVTGLCFWKPGDSNMTFSGNVTQQTVQKNDSSGVMTFNHVYEVPGVYEVEVCCANAFGQANATATVYVEDPVNATIYGNSHHVFGQNITVYWDLIAGTDVQYTISLGGSSQCNGSNVTEGNKTVQNITCLVDPNAYSHQGTYTLEILAYNHVSRLVKYSYIDIDTEISSINIADYETFAVTSVSYDFSVNVDVVDTTNWELVWYENSEPVSFLSGDEGREVTSQIFFNESGYMMMQVEATNAVSKKHDRAIVISENPVKDLSINILSIINPSVPAVIQFTVGEPHPDNAVVYFTFGDGSQTEVVAFEDVLGGYEHKYPDFGDYTLILTVQNHISKSNKTANVRVGKPARELKAEALAQFVRAKLEELSVRISTRQGSGVMYKVDFGDGSEVVEVPRLAEDMEHDVQIVNHTYAQPGPYVINVKAVSRFGIMETNTDQVTSQHPIRGITLENSSPSVVPPGKVLFIFRLEDDIPPPTDASCRYYLGDQEISNAMDFLDFVDKMHTWKYYFGEDLFGVHEISVACENHVSQVDFKTTVTLQEMVGGLQVLITPNPIGVGGILTIEVSLALGNMASFEIDYGDGTEVGRRGPFYERGANFNVTHVYWAEGNYTVEATVQNKVSSAQWSVPVPGVVVRLRITEIFLISDYFVTMPTQGSVGHDFEVRLPVSDAYPSNVYVSFTLDNGVTQNSISTGLTAAGVHQGTFPLTKADVGKVKAFLTVYNLITSVTVEHDMEVQEVITGLNGVALEYVIPVNSDAIFLLSVLTGSHVTFQLDYGDSKAEVLQHPNMFAVSEVTEPVHSYNDSGTYKLTVTAWNNVSSAKYDFNKDMTVEYPVGKLYVTINNPFPVPPGIATVMVDVLPDSPPPSRVRCQFDFGDGAIDDPMAHNLSIGVRHSQQHTFQVFSPLETYVTRVWCRNGISSQFIEKEVTFEGVVSGLKAVTDKVNAPVDGSVCVTISVTRGSDLNFTVEYGDGTVEWVLADDREAKYQPTVVCHSFKDVGQFSISVTASNAVSEQKYNVVQDITVQMPISGFRLDVSSPVHVPPGNADFEVEIYGNLPTDAVYLWQFGDGTMLSDVTVDSKRYTHTHTYDRMSTGTRTVSLTCSNLVSSVTETAVVEVFETIAGLALNVSSYIATVGIKIDFTITMAKGSNVVYDVNFGDGKSTTLHQPLPHDVPRPIHFTYAYNSSGLFDVAVTASNNISMLQVALPTPITAQFEITNLTLTYDDPIPYPPGLVSFAVSVPPSIITPTNISLHIEFGDGVSEIREAFGITTEYPEIITHQYSQSAVGTTQVSIECFNLVSKKRFDVSMVVQERITGLTMLVNKDRTHVGGEATVDISVATGSHLIFEVDFGDGKTQVSSFKSHKRVVMKHTYTVEGYYIIRVAVSNYFGTLKDKAEISVQHPVRSLNVTVNNPVPLPEGQAIFVVNIPNNVSLPTNESLHWSFGDGSLKTTEGALQHTTHFFHQYASAGRYYAECVVSNLISTMTLKTTVDIIETITGIQLQHVTLINPMTTIFDEDESVVSYQSLEEDALLKATIATGSNTTYVWDFGDGSTGLVTVANEVSHRYTKPGDYVVTVTAENQVSSVNTNTTLAVRQGIILQSFGNTGPAPLPNSTVSLVLNVTQFGTDSCYLFDMGDERVRVVYGVEICKEIDYFKKDEIVTIDSTDTIVHDYSYNQDGFFDVKVTAMNRVSFQEMKTRVKSGWPCMRPFVQIIGEYRDILSPRVETKSSRVRLGSNVEIDCRTTKVNITWAIHKVVLIEGEELTNETGFALQPYPLEHISEATGTEIVIPPLTFDIGLYKLDITVAMPGFEGLENGDSMYLSVVKSRLVVGIKGGASRPIGYGLPMVLNADELSYDPDEPHNKTGLLFSWLCRKSDESVPKGCSNNATLLAETRNRTHNSSEGCFGTGYVLKGFSDGNFTAYNTSMLRVNMTYIFRVEMRKDDRCMTSEQSILIVEGDPPDVEIRCVDGCSYKTNPSARLSLTGRCSFCKTFKGIEYTWTVAKVDGQRRQPIAKSLISTYQANTARSSLFTIEGKSLESGFHYSVRLTLKQYGYAAGFSEYTFITNCPPTGGHCDITPEYGYALETEFQVTCAGWWDEGDYLNYEEANANNYQSRKLKYRFWSRRLGSGQQSLIRFGEEPFTPKLTFPLGPATYNHTSEISVQIVDTLGEYAQVNMTIQVVDFPEMDTENKLLELTNPDKLSMLVLGGKQQNIGQIGTIVADTINEEESNGITAINDQEAGEKKKRHEQMRSSVVSALYQTAGSVTSVEAVQQSCITMKAITGKASEVSPDTQVTAASAVENMAEKLKSVDVSDEISENIENTATELVSSLSNILIATDTTVQEKVKPPVTEEELDVMSLSPEEAEQREQDLPTAQKLQQEDEALAKDTAKQVSTKTFKAATAISNLVLKTKTIGSPALVIDSPKLSMVIERSEPSALAGKAVTAREGSFNIPPAIAVKLGEGSGPVDMKVMSLPNNPFIWDESASSINSPVVSLAFQGSDGNELAMDHMEEPFEIRINNSPEKVPIPKRFDPPDPSKESEEENFYYDYEPEIDMDYAFHIIDVPRSDNAIRVIIRPGDPKMLLKVYLRVGDYSSSSEFNVSGIIPREVNMNGTFTEEELDEIQHSVMVPEEIVHSNVSWHLAIQEIDPETNSSMGAPSSNYTLQTLILGCKFWSEAEQRWAGDGCKVSDKSTANVTVCECTHLTSFGSELFTPPNTIDFSTVFSKNIAENAYVLGTVLAITAVYLVCVYFARKGDNRDVQKWSVSQLSDNRLIDNHFYEITVQTGIGKTSGTKSEVFFTLYGENESTRTRTMKAKDKEFSSGSVNKFLMAEHKHLGALQSLRIWHNNSGKGADASWYLDRVQVRDLDTNKMYYFLCDKWLAVNEDDSEVCRTLPVATEEDMKQFNTVFFSTVKRDFNDGHLWFSVFSRPTRSNFTRVQRVTCCLSLLFCTMVSNAMWYDTEKKVRTVHALTIGPITLTFHQLYVSFMSSILIFPVNIGLVTLFRRVREKEAAVYEVGAGEDTAETVEKGDVKDDKEKQSKKKKKKRFMFPYWMVYVAWIVAFLVTFTSAFFSVLYSLDWGAKKSIAWLTSMLMSFTMSVFVLDPIKVILLAALLSLIFRKPSSSEEDDTDDEEMKNKLQDDEDWINEMPPDDGDELEDKLGAPDPVRLAQAKEKMHKQAVMSDLIREIVRYMLLVLVLMLIAYNNKDPSSYNLVKTFRDNFVHVELPLETVRTDHDFWTWVNNTLIPGLYTGSWYNGKRTTLLEQQFLADKLSFRVGPARMRQLRVPPSDLCQIKLDVAGFVEGCTMEYSTELEDQMAYLPGWKYHPNASVLADALQWVYQSSTDLGVDSTSGRLTTYSGGGYEADFGTSNLRAKRASGYLESQGWIDRLTRAIIIEFTAYNANVNLFVAARYILEFGAVGAGLTGQYDIQVLRLYSYVGPFGILNILIEVVYVLYICYAMFKEGKSMKELGCKKYFGDPWNMLEILIIIGSLVSIGFYAAKTIISSFTLSSVQASRDDFVSFQSAITFQSAYSVTLALVVFLSTLKFMKLLRFNKKISLLSATLRHSTTMMVPYGFQFMLVFFAFVHFAIVAFGTNSLSYASFSGSGQTIFGMLLGKFDHKELTQLHWLLGPAMFIVFMIVVFLIMMNISFTIISESFAEVHKELYNQENDYEIMDFLLDGFKKGFRLVKSMVVAIDEDEDKVPVYVDFEPECIVERSNQLFHSIIRLYVREGFEDEDTKAVLQEMSDSGVSVEDLALSVIREHQSRGGPRKLCVYREDIDVEWCPELNSDGERVFVSRPCNNEWTLKETRSTTKEAASRSGNLMGAFSGGKVAKSVTFDDVFEGMASPPHQGRDQKPTLRPGHRLKGRDSWYIPGPGSPDNVDVVHSNSYQATAGLTAPAVSRSRTPAELPTASTANMMKAPDNTGCPAAAVYIEPDESPQDELVFSDNDQEVGEGFDFPTDEKDLLAPAVYVAPSHDDGWHDTYDQLTDDCSKTVEELEMAPASGMGYVMDDNGGGTTPDLWYSVPGEEEDRQPASDTFDLNSWDDL